MAYIGVSPSNGVRQKHTYTATASQTTFSGAGAEGVSLSYRDSNYVDVYVNGVKLGDADYTATSGTSIVLAVGAAVSDIVEIITYDVFSVADTVSKADGGTFDGNVAMAGTLDVTGDLTVDTSTLYVDSTNNRVGIGTTSPDGRLHVHTASAGSVTANSDADDLVVENNGHAGINILSPDANRSAIQFGHTSDNLQLQIRHDGGTSLSQIISDDPIALWTNGSERMRVDSSGNLLVGTTNVSPANGNVQGIALKTNNAQFSANANNAITLNRMTDDGNIIKFKKAGTDVGSIGTQGGTLEVGSGDVYLQFNGTNEWIKPVDGAGSNKANVDLGTSGARFKDLYLSGGVYLGGTGSANYLDDYEEGTFTPIVASTGTNPTVTYSIQEGNYTKIGRQVTITAEIRFSAYTDNGGSFRLEGIPFSVLTDTNYRAVGMISLSNVAVDLTGDYSNLQLAYNSGNSMQVIQNSSVTTGDAETPTSKIDAGTRMRYQITYFTA